MGRHFSARMEEDLASGHGAVHTTPSLVRQPARPNVAPDLPGPLRPVSGVVLRMPRLAGQDILSGQQVELPLASWGCLQFALDPEA